MIMMIVPGTPFDRGQKIGRLLKVCGRNDMINRLIKMTAARDSADTIRLRVEYRRRFADDGYFRPKA